MTPVSRTAYAEFFAHADDNTVFLLQESEANMFWNSTFPPVATSFFNLPGNHWLIKNRNTSIGRWIEDYNADQTASVINTLSKYISWESNSDVHFCINSNVILNTTWLYFMQHWDEFLAIADDCPILLPNQITYIKEAIIFTSLGEILYSASKTHPGKDRV